MSIPDEGREAGAVAMRDFMAYAVLFQDAVARKAGLNGTDVQALGLLLRNGPMTAGALADQTGLTAGGAITAVIDRLASAGLVARSADPGDRRRVLITADPQVAWSRLAPWYADVTERWNAYLAGLSSTEAALVVRAISTAAQINREELARLREK